jgi:hypothetical protein
MHASCEVPLQSQIQCSSAIGFSPKGLVVPSGYSLHQRLRAASWRPSHVTGPTTADSLPWHRAREEADKLLWRGAGTEGRGHAGGRETLPRRGARVRVRTGATRPDGQSVASAFLNAGCHCRHDHPLPARPPETSGPLDSTHQRAIHLGITHQRWAVPLPAHPPAMSGPAGRGST